MLASSALLEFLLSVNLARSHNTIIPRAQIPKIVNNAVRNPGQAQTAIIKISANQTISAKGMI